MEECDKKRLAIACREFRARNRMKQVELAELSGVHSRSISYLETENFKEISNKRLERIRGVIESGYNK